MSHLTWVICVISASFIIWHWSFLLLLPCFSCDMDHSCYFSIILSYFKGHSCSFSLISHLTGVVFFMSASFIIGHGSFLLFQPHLQVDNGHFCYFSPIYNWTMGHSYYFSLIYNSIGVVFMSA